MNLATFAIDDLKTIIIENSTEVKTDIITVHHFRTLLLLNGYDINFDEKVLCTQSVEALKQIIDIVSDLKGTNVNHSRLLSNFPEKTSQLTASYIAWINYITGSLLISNKTQYDEYDVKAQKLTKLNLASIESVQTEFLKIVYAKVPLKSNHEKILFNLFDQKDNFITKINVSEINLKEVLAYYTMYELNEGKEELSVQSATDIVRMISLISGNTNAKLDTPFIVKSLTSKQRRIVISALDKVANIEDVVLNKQIFKRIFFMLHIGSKKYKQFSNIQDIAYQVRNINNPTTKRTIIERLVQYKITPELKYIFNSNPNELALRLDHLLRVNADNQDEIVKLYKELSSKISTKMHLRLIAYFRNRGEDCDSRVVYTKGINGRVKSIHADLPALADNVKKSIILIAISSVVDAYRSEDRMYTKTYIHPDLFKIRLPANMSNSDSSKALARGSRVKIGESKVIRLFTHWKGDVDLDLSIAYMDTNLNQIDSVSFCSLTNDYTIHSGDVRNAPKGATEYIDITLDKVPENVKYGIVYINIYSGSSSAFDNISELFGGFMLRDNAKTKDVYDARTLDNKYTINGSGSACIPYVIDFETNELVWINLNKYMDSGTGVFRGMTSTMNEIYDIMNRKFVSIGDLIIYHTEDDCEIGEFNKDDIPEGALYFDKDFAYNIGDVNALI